VALCGPEEPGVQQTGTESVPSVEQSFVFLRPRARTLDFLREFIRRAQQGWLLLFAQNRDQRADLLSAWFIMVIFYVLLILPAQRRQKKTQAMLSAIKNGDKVITSGGLYGTIVGLEGEAVQLRIADQVKVKVARSAIASVQSDAKEE
jgi:preprotein translocase subunit YajC